MGYEEVETVLPKDFVPKPDLIPPKAVPAPAPVQAPIIEPTPPPPSSPTPKTAQRPPLELPDKHSQAESHAESMASSLVSSQCESDAEESATGKKKKRRNVMSRIKGSWRSVRAVQRRRSRSISSTGSRSSRSTTNSKSSKNSKESRREKKKKSKSGRFGARFAVIRKVDSNATDVRNNTTKAANARKEAETLAAQQQQLQRQEEQAEEEQREQQEEKTQEGGIGKEGDPAHGSVREASPANTTVTACTDDAEVPPPSEVPPPAEVTSSASAEDNVPPVVNDYSVEIGDENEQIQVTTMIESDAGEVAEPTSEPTPMPPVPPAPIASPMRAPSPALPVKLAKSPSTDSARSNRSNRSTMSSRSNKSKTSKGPRPSPRPSPRASPVPIPLSALPNPISLSSPRSFNSFNVSSPRSKQVEEPSFDESLAAKSAASKSNEVDNSKALVPTTTAMTVSGRPSGVTADYSSSTAKPSKPETKQPIRPQAITSEENKENEMSRDTNPSALIIPENPADKRKWVKKVSLSIGGYKTSFQFSDPMSNLAQSVNEALDVVSDAALVGEAKKLDDIGEKIEEERDYDVNPTKLFMYLQQRAWGLALTQMKKSPVEAKIWVFRKATPRPAANVTDGYKSQAIVPQSQALVVHEGDPNKLRWKLLPLHASIVLGAPPEVILEIIRAYPNAAQKTDERGSLPVHLAASRLDVDPEGEKVVLQLFGAYPDSIEIQDRKGRTPPELAKLARMRKDAEEKRRQNVLEQEDLGVEKTASSFEYDGIRVTGSNEKENEESGGGDDSSVKSNKSGRWSLIKKSKSTDTADKRKKKKKKSPSSRMLLSRAKSVDERDLRSKGVSFDEVCKDGGDEEMGPGFAILKPSLSFQQRVKNEIDTSPSEEDGDENEAEADAPEPTPKPKSSDSSIPMGYKTPNAAPGSTEIARSIPLPMSFCEDDTPQRTRSSSPTAPAPEPEQSDSTDNQDEAEQEDDQEEDHPEPEQTNEALRVLLETAAESVGRGAEDVTQYLKVLEDEWVTDVEALRRLDGETLDALLPIILSREVQRLMNQADNIDNKFLTEDKGNKGKWVHDSEYRERGRSPHKKKNKKRVSRRSKKSAETRRLRSDSPQEGPLNTISECEKESDDDMSIKTEAKTVISRASVTSKVRINENPTEMSDKKPSKSEDEEDAPSEFDNELQIRKIHANLIADARKKFPTRESLEDAIRERQAEVEAAVNSGFDVDRQTLSRAALADDEVRKLLPLRLILPTVDDLTEMIGVLQVHKENALRNLNLNKAVSIQTEIDELQAQITEEERYVMRKKMGGTKCIICGEMFATKKRMVGILKTNEQYCLRCKSLNSSGDEVDEKKATMATSEAAFDNLDDDTNSKVSSF